MHKHWGSLLTHCRFLAVVPKGNTKRQHQKAWLMPSKSNSGKHSMSQDITIYWPIAGISYQQQWQLYVPTTCPEWNEGTDKDVKIPQWLSIHAGLTSECVSEVIELFAKQRAENTTKGMMWNEAAKHAATRQVMRPPPCPAKVVEPNTASLSSAFKQYTLLNLLTEAEAQSKSMDDAMVINKPAKPVAGLRKHSDNMDGKWTY